ncbi:MAG: 3-oxoacyl-(acyl-carrier-protein) reductase [Clostridia bacterium]|jgi:NAD(P)-dependent dehydrogenase (short-subunit alcohol dehydrogenase family)|nr:3-oxoacyl-(acyl-carrier-protein) reductase [Clostridia bacterium]
MDFSGKVVIITGSGQGIGNCIAAEYAKKKARVIIAEIDEEAGLETKAYIQSIGGDALFIQTDVGNEDSVKHMVNSVVERYGKIDILINNAAISTQSEHDTLFTRSIEEFEHVMRVNVTGAYMCAKYCAYHMLEGSSIINIVSTRAFMSEPHTEPYSASKGALVALTHSLANSLAHKVRVNAISPGWIDVSQWKKKKDRKFTTLTEKDHSQHLTGRVGVPEDIAHAVLYLTSEEAAFITGANLVIDGGMTVKMIYSE